MAKYLVKKEFIDKETNERYAVGATIDMTVKRAKEVANNLDDTFLEREDG
ncbi:hypothetical protein [Weissella tructae]|nr:hypothetical protein [Weissella tructae]QVV90827.1 hypothetical protein KHQ32_04115 [Weissella tructae]